MNLINLTGVLGDGSDLLPASMVCGDERPCLLCRLDPALLRLHNILVVVLLGRDCAPRRVRITTVCVYIVKLTPRKKKLTLMTANN